jgi:hypothetical protein
VKRFLSNPAGWMAFLFAELIVMSALLRLIVRSFPDLSRGALWALVLVLIVVVTAANYAIRRRYLADRSPRSSGSEGSSGPPR